MSKYYDVPGGRELRAVSAEEARRIRLEQTMIETQRQIDAIDRKAELRKQFALEEWPDTTVIYFEKRFTPNGRLYTYTALKCPNDMWYTSGPQAPGPYTSEQLATFLLNGVDEIWVVDHMTQVYPT